MVKLAEVHNSRLTKDRPVPEIRRSKISFERQLQLTNKQIILFNAYYKVDHRSLGSNVPRRVQARDTIISFSFSELPFCFITSFYLFIYLNLIVIFSIALTYSYHLVLSLSLSQSYRYLFQSSPLFVSNHFIVIVISI